MLSLKIVTFKCVTDNIIRTIEYNIVINKFKIIEIDRLKIIQRIFITHKHLFLYLRH